MEGCRGTTRVIRRRRFTFVLVREARYFDVAELKLPNQTFEHHLECIVSIELDLDIAWSSRVSSRFLNGD